MLQNGLSSPTREFRRNLQVNSCEVIYHVYPHKIFWKENLQSPRFIHRNTLTSDETKILGSTNFSQQKSLLFLSTGINTYQKQKHSNYTVLHSNVTYSLVKNDYIDMFDGLDVGFLIFVYLSCSSYHLLRIFK